MGLDWQAVHETISSRIGLVITRNLGEVNTMQAQRFAVAAGETDSRYFHRDAGSESVAIHPLFLSAVQGWEAGPFEVDLHADGSGPAEIADLPVEGLRLMGAGQSLEFLHPVRSGDCLILELTVEAVELKHGKSGDFIIIQFLRRYFDDDHVELVRCRESLIAR